MSESPNSTLCFGGSFNPVHNGHLGVARAVCEARGFDGILLIPTGQSPHKVNHGSFAAASDRLDMCRIVAEALPIFQACDLETRRAGPSYTIDTARELSGIGIDPVNWLIGADMLNYLPHWHDADALLRKVNFIVVARPGFTFDWAGLPEAFQKLREQVVLTPQFDISATEIRRRVRADESIDGMVPAGVARYIRDHRLYKSSAAHV